MPALERARDVWHAALEAGLGDADFTSILKFVEEVNGTRVRGQGI